MSFMTVKKAAERLGVSVALVYELCHERKLGHVRVGAARGVIRIREEDLDDYLKRAAVRPEEATPITPQPRMPQLKHLKVQSGATRTRLRK